MTLMTFPEHVRTFSLRVYVLGATESYTLPEDIAKLLSVT